MKRSQLNAIKMNKILILTGMFQSGNYSRWQVTMNEEIKSTIKSWQRKWFSSSLNVEHVKSNWFRQNSQQPIFFHILSLKYIELTKVWIELIEVKTRHIFKEKWDVFCVWFILFYLAQYGFFCYLCFLRKELNLQQLLDRLRFEIEKNRISLTLHWFETKGEYVNVWREDILIKNGE